MKRELGLGEIQDNSFHVLLKIKEICEKNNFSFYLAYGTLLGAVRHNGFIPWDDDIDIWMPRKDYEKFLSFCKKYSDEIKPFEILHYSNTKNYPYCIARFSDSRFQIDYCGVKNYGLGLFVDVYPLDKIDINNKKFVNKTKKNTLNVLRYNTYTKSKIRNRIVNLIKPFFLISNLCLSMKSYMKKVDRFAQKYNVSETNEYLQVNSWNFDFCSPIKSSDIYSEKKVFLLFNGVYMPVPKNYDEVLKNQYGKYMELPPIEERLGHHNYKVFIEE